MKKKDINKKQLSTILEKLRQENFPSPNYKKLSKTISITLKRLSKNKPKSKPFFPQWSTRWGLKESREDQ